MPEKRWPEILFREGKLAPRLSISILSVKLRKKITEAKLRRAALVNAISSIRPLAASGAKLVSVRELSYTGGHRLTLGPHYVFRKGDLAGFRAVYQNNSALPLTARLSLSVDGASKSAIHRFRRRGDTTSLTVDYRVERPVVVTARATIEAAGLISRLGRLLTRRGLALSDSVQRRLSFGVLDDSPKPLSEYPVSGAQNEELDVPASWAVKNYVYPNPPSDITITPSLDALYGIRRIDGRYYRVPGEIVRARVSWTVRNDSRNDISVIPFFGVVGVLYEDLKHASMVTIDMSGVPKVDLAPAYVREPEMREYTFSLEVGIPEWAYGHVSIALAQVYMVGSRMIYFGGPVYQFDLGRILLP